jgi:protocatechuate 3,4-dioxygenase alpha subunit
MSEAATSGAATQEGADLGLTPSQTVGPYLAIALDWGADGQRVVPDGTPGAFWITGRVFDGRGTPVPDALVETWQADPEGRFASREDPRGEPASALPGFRGLGRCATDGDGRWSVLTVRPGALPAEDGREQAPHLDVSVLARGLLDRVVTRLYFPDEAAANDADPVLGAVPAERRSTLVAVPGGSTDAAGLVFDVHLQGEGETVFFTV